MVQYTLIDMEPHVVETEGVTVDHMLWRFYRRPMYGLVEFALEHPLNYQLEQQGPYLEVGTLVYLPVVEVSAFEEIPVVSLWS